jgi:hypothetical protein
MATEPDNELRERINAFVTEIGLWAGQLWVAEHVHPLAHPGHWESPSYNPELYNAISQARKASLARLRDRWPDEVVGDIAVEMLLKPELWKPEFTGNTFSIGLNGRQDEVVIVYHILVECLITIPPPNLLERLNSTLDALAQLIPSLSQEPKHPYNRARLTLVAGLQTCLMLLITLPADEALLNLIEHLIIEEGEQGPVLSRFKNVVASSFLETVYHRLMKRLHDAGRFNYIDYEAVVTTLPSIHYNFETLRIYLKSVDNGDGTTRTLGNIPPATPFQQEMMNYGTRLAWSIAQNLTEQNYELIKRHERLEGGPFLMRAAHYHHALGLGDLVLVHNYAEYRYQPGIHTAVIHMAHTCTIDLNRENEKQALISQLKEFPVYTLKCLLPVASLAGRIVLCEALGWRAGIPLLMEITSEKMDAISKNSPTVSRLPIANIREALGKLNTDDMHELLLGFRKSNAERDTIMLIEAIAGTNRDEVKRRAAKRVQSAVKAYGLLSVEDGEAEVMERYLFLKQFADESSSYGSQRQANERAAVQFALLHLALQLGYADVAQFEWAIEARISPTLTEPNRTWEIGRYILELTFKAGEPVLIVHQGERQLKTVPSAVRQTEIYQQAKANVENLRDQARRFRTAFEQAMVAGSELNRNDLANLSRLPIAREILSQLIFCTDDLLSGTVTLDDLMLHPLNLPPIPVPETVKIAHPNHLFNAGVLAVWQQEVVSRRWVQAFKQVFRELYVLTPAEHETRTYSNRFAGHPIDSHVTARLLQSRNWHIDNHEAIADKQFITHNIKAVFSFRGNGHYFTESRDVFSEQIQFYLAGSNDETRLPLEDIPPLIFSEVMRDADLVVSVAQRSGEISLSREAYERRGELVTALLADLGLAGVRVEGHFAYIKGKLANYRVHLASAAIHIEPGNYLCIVPKLWGLRHDNLFLPFADRDDAKVSEVISKIFLLINDDQIRDESIMRQILRH